MEATGESTISAKPNEALIDIGVVTAASSTAAAAAQNATQTNAVLADLRRLLGGDSRLQTTSYSIAPNYQYPKPGASPNITGYTATHTVQVTLDDLSQIGKVIDAATQSGANRIQSLRYRLKNAEELRNRALKEAAARAKASAEAIADGLGVHVLRVLSAQEGAPDEDVGYAKKAAPLLRVAAAAAPEIEVGTVDVEAIVTVRVEVQ